MVWTEAQGLRLREGLEKGAVAGLLHCSID